MPRGALTSSYLGLLVPQLPWLLTLLLFLLKSVLPLLPPSAAEAIEAAEAGTGERHGLWEVAHPADLTAVPGWLADLVRWSTDRLHTSLTHERTHSLSPSRLPAPTQRTMRVDWMVGGGGGGGWPGDASAGCPVSTSCSACLVRHSPSQRSCVSFPHETLALCQTLTFLFSSAFSHLLLLRVHFSFFAKAVTQSVGG